MVELDNFYKQHYVISKVTELLSLPIEDEKRKKIELSLSLIQLKFKRIFRSAVFLNKLTGSYLGVNKSKRLAVPVSTNPTVRRKERELGTLELTDEYKERIEEYRNISDIKHGQVFNKNIYSG